MGFYHSHDATQGAEYLRRILKVQKSGFIESNSFFVDSYLASLEAKDVTLTKFMITKRLAKEYKLVREGRDWTFGEFRFS